MPESGSLCHLPQAIFENSPSNPLIEAIEEFCWTGQPGLHLLAAALPQWQTLFVRSNRFMGMAWHCTAMKRQYVAEERQGCVTSVQLEGFT